MQQDGFGHERKYHRCFLRFNLSDHLGGLVLKEEQNLVVEALLSGKDVMGILPTGFGKSIIYQSFVVAKNLAILVVVPLRSMPYYTS